MRPTHVFCYTLLDTMKEKRPYDDDDLYKTSTPVVSAHSPKSRLMLSPLCVLRMLSAIVGLMSIVTNFLHMF